MALGAGSIDNRMPVRPPGEQSKLQRASHALEGVDKETLTLLERGKRLDRGLNITWIELFNACAIDGLSHGTPA